MLFRYMVGGSGDPHLIIFEIDNQPTIMLIAWEMLSCEMLSWEMFYLTCCRHFGDISNEELVHAL